MQEELGARAIAEDEEEAEGEGERASRLRLEPRRAASSYELREHDHVTFTGLGAPGTYWFAC